MNSGKRMMLVFAGAAFLLSACGLSRPDLVPDALDLYKEKKEELEEVVSSVASFELPGALGEIADLVTGNGWEEDPASEKDPGKQGKDPGKAGGKKRTGFQEIKDIVLYDVGGLKVTLNGVEKQGDYYALQYACESSSSIPLHIQGDAFSLNGICLPGGEILLDVDAGGKAEMESYLEEAVLDLADMGEVFEIGTEIIVYGQDYMALADEYVTVRVGDGKGEASAPEIPEGKDELYSEDGVTISHIKTVQDKNFLKTYYAVENTSDRTFRWWIGSEDKDSLNGQIYDDLYPQLQGGTLPPGMSGIAMCELILPEEIAKAGTKVESADLQAMIDDSEGRTKYMDIHFSAEGKEMTASAGPAELSERDKAAMAREEEWQREEEEKEAALAAAVPAEISETCLFVEHTGKKYSAFTAAVVRNPNTDVAMTHVAVTISVLNSRGEELAENKVSDLVFLKPGEEVPLIGWAVSLEEEPASIKVEFTRDGMDSLVTKDNWEHYEEDSSSFSKALSEISVHNVKIQPPEEVRYTETLKITNPAKVLGRVRNESGTDESTVTVACMFRGADGKLLLCRTGTVKDLAAGTEQDMELNLQTDELPEFDHLEFRCYSGYL